MTRKELIEWLIDERYRDEVINFCLFILSFSVQKHVLGSFSITTASVITRLGDFKIKSYFYLKTLFGAATFCQLTTSPMWI